MGKHLVFVGGGHAHLTALSNLTDFVRIGCRVTLVSPSPFHYYSGMGPGLLGGTYRPEEIRFHVQKLAEDRGGFFVRGKAVRIDPERKTLYVDSGAEVDYDLISFNIGSEVHPPVLSGKAMPVFPVKPIENLLEARTLLREVVRKKDPDLLVVGGGPAGVEIAANLSKYVQGEGGSAKITLAASGPVLSGFPEKARRFALKSLTGRRIRVKEGIRVDRFEADHALLENGGALPADIAFLTWGIAPSPFFRDSGLPTGNDGGLLVDACLRSVSYPEIFGGGDCVAFRDHPLDRVGVYPVRQNPVLRHNLLAAVTGRRMKRFEPSDRYLLIFNMGDGTGIFCRGGWVFKGRLSFLLKDRIDRRFMRKFQVSGERGS